MGTLQAPTSGHEVCCYRDMVTAKKKDLTGAYFKHSSDRALKA